MVATEPTIYMDESGDLGYDFTQSKTSRYFIVAFVMTNYPNRLDKIVKKVYSGFTKTEIKAHHGVLHCNKELPSTRFRLLNKLSESESVVFSLVLDKRRLSVRAEYEKHALYNYIVGALLDIIKSNSLLPKGRVRFVASKRETNKYLNDQFVNQLSDNKLIVDIRTPAEEKGLQVADFVAWSFYNRYEHGDSDYSDAIKSISIEHVIFEQR